MATNPTAYQVIYSREYRKKKKALGLCLRCKEPAKSSSLCEFHLTKKKEYTNKTRKERRSQGLCVYCGLVRPCDCKSKKPTRFSQLKSNAKKRGLIVSLSAKEFNEWINNTEHKCTYCGIAAEDLKRSVSKRAGLEVDRMDNQKGYEKDNICLACHRCNTNKSNFFTFEEWKKIATECIIPRLMEYQGII